MALLINWILSYILSVSDIYKLPCVQSAFLHFSIRDIAYIIKKSTLCTIFTTKPFKTVQVSGWPEGLKTLVQAVSLIL